MHSVKIEMEINTSHRPKRVTFLRGGLDFEKALSAVFKINGQWI